MILVQAVDELIEERKRNQGPGLRSRHVDFRVRPTSLRTIEKLRKSKKKSFMNKYTVGE